MRCTKILNSKHIWPQGLGEGWGRWTVPTHRSAGAGDSLVKGNRLNLAPGFRRVMVLLSWLFHLEVKQLCPVLVLRGGGAHRPAEGGRGAGGQGGTGLPACGGGSRPSPTQDPPSPGKLVTTGPTVTFWGTESSRRASWGHSGEVQAKGTWECGSDRRDKRHSCW